MSSVMVNNSEQMKKKVIEDTIRQIYSTRQVLGASGQVHNLEESEIDAEEGKFLEDLILNDPNVCKTLEVGCAFGLSSLHICAGLTQRESASHTIIDPFQSSNWDSVGVRTLRELGVDFFDLVEQKSEIALPALLAKNEASYDFVFVDGWHTFDHALMDCFYSTRLLKVGGYLVIDDVTFPSVRRVVDYLLSYPCFEQYGSVDYLLHPSVKKRAFRLFVKSFGFDKLSARFLRNRYSKFLFDDRYERMVALKKVSEDHRNWNWHFDNF